MFVGGYNRVHLGGARQGSTSHSPCFPNPSSLDFWLESFYNFDITKILIIVVRWGRGNWFLVAILCIAISPVVIPVPYCRGWCRSSLNGPCWRGGLLNAGLNASLSASQSFNIDVRGVLVCVALFRPLGQHTRPCTWRVRLPLFRFDPFFLLLELLPLLNLAISLDLLEPTLLLFLPLLLMRPILPLEGEI